MKYPYPLVEVVWVDAETGHGWEEEDETEPMLPVVVTAGFLLKQTEELVCIASSVSATKNHNGRISIPTGMVKSLKVLKK